MSSPCASGEKAITPSPFRSHASRTPPSIQRSKMLYDGWWMTSGRCSSRAISADVSVLSAPYEEMPAYSALPWRTAVSSAPIVSSSGVSWSRRCE